MIIYGDVNEPQIVHRAFKKRLGDQYKTKQLGFHECRSRHIIMENKQGFTWCAALYEVDELQRLGFSASLNREKCIGCQHHHYKRVSDFTNDIGSFYAERKTIGDFLSSMKERLYKQMNNMDKFVQDNHKIVILEGTPRENRTVKLSDSKNFFSGIDRQHHDLRGLSPIEQAISVSGSPEWVWSFIREAFMRGIMFVQTWDLNETVEFIIQADEGFGKESKHRVIPKTYPQLPLEQAILCQFKGIAIKRSEKILDNDYATLMKLKGLIKHVKKKYKIK